VLTAYVIGAILAFAIAFANDPSIVGVGRAIFCAIVWPIVAVYFFALAILNRKP
jgi:hypothetical protein